MRRWTTEDESLLEELYPTTDYATLSSMLGRSISAIENKASRMGLRKIEGSEEEEEPSSDRFSNPFELASREEALKRDKIDLLRINWSLSSMYQRELRNPDLTKAERHRLMNALSNHTSIINSVMRGVEEELGEEESLEDRFIEISSRDSARFIKARRVRILVERPPVEVE
jgi:hypothetical protein